MIGWLNLGSLVLGLMACILPVVNLTRYTTKWVALSTMSISACAVALFLQIYSFYNRVKLEDWSALMDTMGAKVFTAAFLLIVTIILNVVTLIVYHKRIVR